MKNKLILAIILGIILSSSILLAVVNDAELREKYQEKKAYKRSVYDKTLMFIENNSDSPGIGKLYYNLAEMSVEINVLEPEITASYYQKVIELDPDFEKMDAVLYNFGYYFWEGQINNRDDSREKNIDLAVNWPDYLRISEENLKPAIDAFQRVLGDFPNSSYTSDVIFRLGNLYFDIALDARLPLEYYDKALYYFDNLAQKDGDPLQYHGIFQKGWSYFASARFEEAIEQFSQILAFIDTDSLKTFKTYFEADAIENVAFSLIEYDGSEFEQYSVAADQAVEIFAKYNNDDYVREIIMESVELKQKYNAPMQAIDLYNSYIRLYPTSIEAPVFIDSIMTIYKRNPARTRDEEPAEKLIIDQMNRLVTEYNPNSDWYQENKNDLSAESRPLEVIHDAFSFIEPRYNNNFVRSKKYDDYLQYRDLVNNFIGFEEFTDSLSLANIKNMRKKVVDMSQGIAETTKKPFDYFTAINNIAVYDSIYHDIESKNEYQEIKYNNFEQIYTILQDTVKVAPYEIAELEMVIDQASLDSLYANASHEFQEYLYSNENVSGNNETLIRVIYNRAEKNYDNNKFELASVDYSELLQVVLRDSANADPQLLKISYARLGDINQQNKEFVEAENYFRLANEFADEEEQAQFKTNILASMQQNANTLADSSDYVTAAEEFLRLSSELENSDLEQSISFKTKAIENYKSAEEYQEAIDLLLEISEVKTEKNDKLNAFVNAWTISDSLQDYRQSETLRYQFIELYPNSNEAYKLRVQIIDFYENEPYQDSLKAADMYLGLHNDAVEGNLDIGEVASSGILLKAISLYDENLYESKRVDLMLEFEKRYPQHEKSQDFLIYVAKVYERNGEDEKFEDLARDIYKKHPSINILQNVAIDKLTKVTENINSAFEQKDYDTMYIEIDKFKKMDRDYKADGLSLPLESIYNSFKYYNDYIEYYQKFDLKIAQITEDFLDANPNDLVRVNENTKWKDHLNAGKKRINKLRTRCVDSQKMLIDLIKEGDNFELPTEKRVEALYLAGKIFEHGSEIIDIQLTKYINISTQLNGSKISENPVLQKTYKDQIQSAKAQIITEFIVGAAKIYNSLLITFVDNSDYSDQYTEMAYQKLVDWEVRKPKVYRSIYTDLRWEVNSGPDSTGVILWNNVDVVSEQVFLDSASVIELNPSTEKEIRTEFDLDYLPELYYVDYISDFQAEVYINGQKLEQKTEASQLIEYDGRNLQEFNEAFNTNLKLGNNELLFKVPGNSSSIVNFAAHIKLQFDKERLEFARSTEEKVLYSDSSWKVQTKTNLDLDELLVNLNQSSEIPWESVGPANFQFYKNQIYGMENSDADEIWLPVIDTTKAETAIFIKEFEETQDVVEAEITFLGQDKCSIWVNGELVIENSSTIFDAKLQKSQSYSATLTNLRKGKNSIVVEVQGTKNYKGLIFELNYIVRK